MEFGCLVDGIVDGGREIDRSEYTEAIDQNAECYKNNKELYRKRQGINENFFGTIKLKWSYYFAYLRGLERVNGEHSFICLVYNLVRTMNILSVRVIIEKLECWTPNYRMIVRSIFYRFILLNLEQLKFNYFINIVKISFDMNTLNGSKSIQKDHWPT